jgi:hypothetical protein
MADLWPCVRFACRVLTLISKARGHFPLTPVLSAIQGKVISPRRIVRATALAVAALR